jgi:nucleotide-binding universal stress UspA family protein
MAVSLASIGPATHGAAVPECGSVVSGAPQRLFTNVLVGVDGQQGGREAIALASTLAADDARITLANLYVPTVSIRRVDGGAEFVARAERSRQMLEGELKRAGFEATAISQPGRAVGDDLHALGEQMHADLIVVGSCRRGLLGRVFLGDDTRATLNGAACAVAIAPSGYQAPRRFKQIGIGYDGSPESVEALGVAQELARSHDARVKALAVVSARNIMYEEPEADWHETAAHMVEHERRRLEQLGDVASIVTYGEPSDELTHFSDELDLLVLGSRNQGPLDRLFEGSTSNHLARRTHCPLLVLPRGSNTLTSGRPDESDPGSA